MMILLRSLRQPKSPTDAIASGRYYPALPQTDALDGCHVPRPLSPGEGQGWPRGAAPLSRGGAAMATSEVRDRIAAYGPGTSDSKLLTVLGAEDAAGCDVSELAWRKDLLGCPSPVQG
jgi:hypothetical protein